MYTEAKYYNEGAPGTATQQAKILAVCRALGISHTSVMQATSRALYDSLPMDGRTTFEFFKGCNNREFPFTNLSQNRLEVGEAMVIEWITMGTAIAEVPPIVTASGGLFAGGDINVYSGSIDIEVANSLVLKDLSTANIRDLNNESSNYVTNEPYHLRTLIVIPSLQEFNVILRQAAAIAVPTGYLRMCISGTGIIYRTNQTFENLTTKP